MAIISDNRAALKETASLRAGVGESRPIGLSVPDAFQALKAELDALEAVAGQIGKQLNPVLVPEPPQDTIAEKEPPRQGVSPLAEAVFEQVQRLRGLHHFWSDISSRLSI